MFPLLFEGVFCIEKGCRNLLTTVLESVGTFPLLAFLLQYQIDELVSPTRRGNFRGSPGLGVTTCIPLVSNYEITVPF